MKVLLRLIGILWISLANHLAAQNFTEQASALGINLTGNKDGGLAWGDFNNDGCLDLAVNTSTNNGTHLYLSSCSSNPDHITFTDVTLTYAQSLSQNGGVGSRERSVIWGDFNNDGYLDLARNGSNIIEIYLNKGPLASPAYSLGDNSQNPNFTFTNTQINGINSEGMAWADIDGNGWLDLVFNNHGNGVEILYKNTSGASACTDGFNFSDGNTIGFANGTSEGDYLAVGDLNDDGYPDIVDRSNATGRDLFVNDGDGTFTVNTNFSETAQNNNKGGVAMCDLDNDGDLDIFWTEGSRNVIYENLGGNPLNFTQRPESAALGINPGPVIDDCACGDVDNDGDEDIFLSSNTGTNFLYKNQLNSGAPFSFVQANGGIGQNGANPFNRNGEACVLVDYDNDGDLDVSLNIQNNANQLWRSDLITTASPEANRDYLKVKILIQNPSSAQHQALARYAIGAQASLRRLPAEGGARVSGVKEVNGGRGHGTQDPPILHFGLPDGAELTYELTVKFPTMNGMRAVIVTQIRPADLADRTLVIAKAAEEFGVSACNNTVALPIRLLDFKASQKEDAILIEWITAQEENNSFFTLERSPDGQNFSHIAHIDGAGNSNSLQTYHFEDLQPLPGVNYYRLKQTDFDGTVSYSSTIAVSYDMSRKLDIFPNPAQGNFAIKISSPDEKARLSIYNHQGILIKEIPLEQTTKSLVALQENLKPGVYFIHLQHKNGREVQKLLVQ